MAENESFLEMDMDDLNISAFIKLQGFVRGFLVRRVLREIRKDYEDIVKDIDNNDNTEIHWRGKFVTPTFQKCRCPANRKQRHEDELLKESKGRHGEILTKCNNGMISHAPVLKTDIGCDNNFDLRLQSNLNVEGHMRQKEHAYGVEARTVHDINSNNGASVSTCSVDESNCLPIVLDQCEQIDFNSEMKEFDINDSEDRIMPHFSGGNKLSNTDQTDNLDCNIDGGKIDFEKENYRKENCNNVQRNSYTCSYDRKDGISPLSINDNEEGVTRTQEFCDPVCDKFSEAKINVDDETEITKSKLSVAVWSDGGEGSVMKHVKAPDSPVDNNKNLPTNSSHVVDAAVSPIKFIESSVMRQEIHNHSPAESRNSSDVETLDDVQDNHDLDSNPIFFLRASKESENSSVGHVERDGEGTTGDDGIISQPMHTFGEEPLPDDKASLLELKKTTTMELLWIQQAINSRKHYLRLKQQMA